MATAEYIGPKDSLDILLVGRTGDGKSETGNNILGRETFPTSSDAESETKTANYDWCHFEGKNIKVVDTPGLKDTRLGVKDDAQQLIDAIQIAIVNNPEGYHAILYVIKFGNRFSKEDEFAIFTLKVLLGDDFFKDHGILVITYGDCFESEPTVRKLHLSFEAWLERQKNKQFKNILKECQNRAVLFDNRTDDVDKRLAQVRKLTEMIKGQSSKGNRYTNEDFDRVKNKRNELLVSLGKKQERQDAIDIIGTLISKIKQATDNEEGSEALRLVSGEIDDLEMHVNTVKVKNERLYTLSPLLNELREALKAKKNQVANMIGYIDLLDEQKIKYEKVMDEYQRRLAHGHTDKDARQKEKDLQNIERNREKTASDFKISREDDLKKTNKIIDKLEDRYDFERHNNEDDISPSLLVFIRSFFGIDRFLKRISQFFR